MAIWLGLAATITLLMLAVAKGVYIGWPLIAGYIYFACLNLKRGRSPAQIFAVSKAAGSKSFIVVPILLLIGAVVSLWMSSGTVGALVYYGLQIISPPLFIACAFLLCSLISLLLGSSLGTVGTIGVILMVLARGSGVDIYVTAGAIVSGIYVGDRCSPMSSAVYLLSAVTETDPHDNIRMLMKTTFWPFVLSMLLYLLISPRYPLLPGESTLRQDISANFNLGWPTFVPALIIIVLAALRTNVKISTFASAVCAALVSFLLQGMGGAEIFSVMLWGYHPPPDNALAGIIQGGGVWGMAKTCLVLMSASWFTGMLEYAGALTYLQQLLLKPCGRLALYLKTMLVGVLSICCGCNQAIGVILSGQLMRQPYEACGLDKHDLAKDISFTAVPISAAIPWNMAAMVPMTTLGIEKALHVPFLFFPLLMPLFYGLIYAYQGRRGAARGQVAGK